MRKNEGDTQTVHFKLLPNEIEDMDYCVKEQGFRNRREWLSSIIRKLKKALREE